MTDENAGRLVLLDEEAYLALAPVVAAAIARTESPAALIRAARALRCAGTQEAFVQRVVDGTKERFGKGERSV